MASIDKAIDEQFPNKFEASAIKDNPHKQNLVRKLHEEFSKMLNTKKLIISNDKMQKALDTTIRDFTRAHGELFKKMINKKRYVDPKFNRV